jgi:parallel beta-helix repeat protein
MLQVSATEYYLSNNGNDKDKGTSPETSFKTLQQLNKVKLKPGDKVYFKAGDTFEGTLQINRSGKPGNPIVFTSYGEGAKPVITGAVKINNFKHQGNNIYAANCEEHIQYLCNNDNIMIRARYPNTGFLKIDNGSAEHLVDKDLPFGKNKLKGATAYVQIYVWLYKYRTVAENTSNTLRFETTFNPDPEKKHACKTGWNYYLDNKKAFLDTTNEWYYSPKEKKLYIYSEKPLTQNTTFEGASKENGIVLAKGVSHITIENLEVCGQSETGINGLGDNSNIEILNNEIAKIGKFGIFFEKTGHKLTVKNNDLHDITGNGIKMFHANHSIIENNTVKRIGTIAGYGINGLNGATGICVVNYEKKYEDTTAISYNNKIQNNYVEEIGYNGIRFEGYNTLVEGNVVRNALLNMYDGGLIYTWSNKSPYTFNCTIKDNLLMNNVPEEHGGHKIRLGIYLDYAVDNIVVENNTVINVKNGIMTNGGSTNSTIKNNLVYGCENGIKIIQKDWTVDVPHTVIGNTIICKKNLGTTLSLENHRGTKTNAGTIDKNTYVSLDEKFHIGRIRVDEDRKTVETFTLEGWQAEMGVDKNASFYVPEKDGKMYPYSDILVNETEGSKTFPLDPKYEYVDLDGNIVSKEITLSAKQAKVVFYK